MPQLCSQEILLESQKEENHTERKQGNKGYSDFIDENSGAKKETGGDGDTDEERVERGEEDGSNWKCSSSQLQNMIILIFVEKSYIDSLVLIGGTNKAIIDQINKD